MKNQKNPSRHYSKEANLILLRLKAIWLLLTKRNFMLFILAPESKLIFQKIISKEIRRTDYDYRIENQILTNSILEKIIERKTERIKQIADEQSKGK